MPRGNFDLRDVVPMMEVDGSNPELSVGPLVIGVLLNVWLYGMILMQIHQYFHSISSRDARWLRHLVLWVLLLDTVNTVLDIIIGYQFAVTQFGNFASIYMTTWALSSDPAMTAITSATVQAFYAWRVQKLTGARWLAVLLWISAAVQLLCGLGATVGLVIIKDLEQVQKLKSLVITWLVLAPLTDMLIAIPLVAYLHKKRTGVHSTDDILEKITRSVIQTGAITALWSIADLALYLAMKNNIHFIFNLSLSKLYTNCLMSSLNARAYWDENSHGSDLSAGGIHITMSSGTQRDSYALNDRVIVLEGEFDRAETQASRNRSDWGSQKLPSFGSFRRTNRTLPPIIDTKPYSTNVSDYTVSPTYVGDAESTISERGCGRSRSRGRLSNTSISSEVTRQDKRPRSEVGSVYLSVLGQGRREAVPGDERSGSPKPAGPFQGTSPTTGLTPTVDLGLDLEAQHTSPDRSISSNNDPALIIRRPSPVLSPPVG